MACSVVSAGGSRSNGWRGFPAMSNCRENATHLSCLFPATYAFCCPTLCRVPTMEWRPETPRPRLFHHWDVVDHRNSRRCASAACLGFVVECFPRWLYRDFNASSGSLCSSVEIIPTSPRPAKPAVAIRRSTAALRSRNPSSDVRSMRWPTSCRSLRRRTGMRRPTGTAIE